MYDFNLQIGSHIQYLMPPNYESNNLFLMESPVVYAIDSVYFDGEPHKRYKYHFSITTNPDLYPDALIEGFGNTRGFIYPRPDYPVTGSHDYRDLQCLSIDAQPVFQTGTVCCESGDSCLTTAITETSLKQIDLRCFQEDQKMIFHVDNPLNISLNLVIYDVLGTEQYRFSVHETDNFIVPISSLSPTTHIAMLVNNSYPEVTKKFLPR